MIEVKPLPWDGTRENRPKLIEPGIYTCPGEVFARAPGISVTSLGYLLRSPFHLKDRWDHPERYPRDKAAFVLGNMIHTLLFEPDQFDARYFVTPDGFTRRSKADKEKWAEWIDRYGEENIIHDRDAKAAYRRATDIVDAIKGRTYTATALSGGWPEVAVFWQDRESGVRCKAKADYIRPLSDGALLVSDLKTTKDASPEQFEKSVGNFGYDRQNAFFRDGVAEATGLDVDFMFVAVEKEAPYAVAEYELRAEDVDKGRQDYQYALRVYKQCKERDEWPGYPELSRIKLPRWVKRHSIEQLNHAA